MSRYIAPLGFTLAAVWIAVVFVLASGTADAPPARRRPARSDGSRDVHSRLIAGRRRARTAAPTPTYHWVDLRGSVR